MNVTKAHLAAMTAKSGPPWGLRVRSELNCLRVIESFLEIVKQKLQAGATIELRGFGVFKTKTVKARRVVGNMGKARGEYFIPERRVMKWKPTSDLKWVKP